MQRSFDDLGTPLCDVTFCVIDIETTGGSAADGGITEIGAVKVRGGEVLGTYQTMVNPGSALPPFITVLTGITQAMVMRAPRIEAVLPSLVEFTAGTVLVGHNVRYDTGFLNAAFERAGYERFANPVIDTCSLARRLVRDEVPNCKLGTLAQQLRLDHQPTHRALDDALATCDLLHFLLERATALGVLGLDDLMALPRLGGHPQVAKLKLTNHLPRSPGVYLFKGARNEVLYVGKATNLRQRVRSYFSGDDRRKIGNLLREVQTIDHIVCPTTLDATVTELRLIHQHQPRYNRVGRTVGGYQYVKLTLAEVFPRLVVTRRVCDDGALYVGPLSSVSAARSVIDAVHSVVPLRRCGGVIGRRARPSRDGVCTAAQLGVASCPCSGELAPHDYAPHVERVVRALSGRPAELLEPLRTRMFELAAAGRYEEAADMRDRGDALAGALRRQQRLDTLRRAGFVRLSFTDGSGAELQAGLLFRSWGPDGASRLPLHDSQFMPAHGPVPPDLADEVLGIAAWLDKEAVHVRVEHCDEPLTMPYPALPSFTPGRASRSGFAGARRPGLSHAGLFDASISRSSAAAAPPESMAARAISSPSAMRSTRPAT